MRWLLAALIVSCLATESGLANEVTCEVKYLSSEHIYLDAGSAQRLTIGLLGKVVRDGKAVGEIEIVFVAGQSATAKAKQNSPQIVAGDRIVFTVEAIPEADSETVVPVARRSRLSGSSSSQRRSATGPLVRGSIAIQWDHAAEGDGGDLKTDIIRAPFRVETRALVSGFKFRARGSLRNYSRTGFSASTPAQEWRNRIYEVSLLREHHDQTWHYAVGRVGGRASSGAGPFDGARISRRTGSNSRLGIFGGFTPEWGDLGFGTEDHLVGLDYRFNRRFASGRSFDLILAGIGRYRSNEISREYLTMTTNWRAGGGFSLLQAAEVDFNRGWRKESDESSVLLSSFALSGRYQIIPQVTVNLGYDNRDPVRTWESRSIPDSLFQGAGRQGYRVGLRLRPGYRMSVNLSASLRREDHSAEDVTAWRIRWDAPSLIGKRTALFASLRGFDGPWLSGWAPSFGVSQRWQMGLQGRLEGGLYNYTGSIDNSSRENVWASLGLSKSLRHDLHVSANYRQDWGDDIVGSRWFLELRKQF